MLFLALPILACVGFTAVGVTAGSFAALWQSAFGTGPVFNTLLSAGMGGAHAVTVVSTSTSAIFWCYVLRYQDAHLAASQRT
ncbi:hypothetical protein D6D19_09445 [Aureobasidium pullulans]|uniref:Uncharacterized protein n=1 Tax=Aureobasidium pullulans TaxID=5580 RepID=A0A4S8ZFR2_AURPU|nr:hypothetical protein D6D28_08845 [Aureobasidium pullulans]THW64655.1 hypothetical protein D6D19_09445 [Aureobasidium pullulans]